MIAPPAGVRIWLVAGATDMRRGFDGLAALVAQQLDHDPFSGQVFAFRGRRGGRVTFYLPPVKFRADAWRHFFDIVEMLSDVGA